MVIDNIKGYRDKMDYVEAIHTIHSGKGSGNVSQESSIS